MALSEVTLLKCSEHLSAYKSACEFHPELKSYDSSLQQRTNKAIDSLTAEAEKRTNIVKDLLTADAKKRTNKETAEAQTGLLLSQHAVHKEVCSHFHEVFQGVADFIVENKDDVWENKSLKSLVQAYLESTHKTIAILDKVETCVEKADDGQRFILQALAQFEKESADDDGGKRKKYEKTLDKLNKFKAIGNPFSGRELKTQFELVKKEQESLLEQVSEARKKIEEELESLNKKSLVTNIVFGAVMAVVAVASIALIATGVGAPAGIALALSLPLLAIGWVATHTILENQIKALKKQEEALKELEKKYESVGRGIVLSEEAMESVSQNVDRLEAKILAILKLADDALDNEADETDIKFDLESIRDNVKKLTQGIKEVGEAVSDARRLIDKAKKNVMEKITDSA